ncbi:MAG: membrane protein of unknown function [Promethearchaeota archaeon]|nr:MAG: membrane protein of unknown function [Candidatus Lokiarchaeota archaeon]
MTIEKSINSLQEEPFTEESVFQYVEDFSFPRLAGTEGERKAVALTIQRFNEIGFKQEEIIQEPFEFSDFYSTTLIKLVGMITCIFLLAFLLFSYIEIYISLLILAVLGAIVVMIMRGLKSPEDPGFWGKYYGEIFEATNVYVKVPSKKLPEQEAGNIVISAHLDSKSQNFKTAIRVNVYRLFVIGGFSFCIFILIKTIWYFLFMGFYFAIKLRTWILVGLLLDYGLWISAGCIIIANLFLMFLNTHNKSPGALDNASGMAIVFELSSYFRTNPLKNYNVWFCQFSAEELGTMGSRIFLNNQKEEFEQGKIFQYNIDMISCKGCSKHNRIEYIESYGIIPKKKFTTLCSKYLERAALKNNIDIFGVHFLTGAHTDSLPFHAKEFDALDLGSISASKWGHTAEDTPDKVDSKILKETCVLLKNALLEIDSDYYKLDNRIEYSKK